MSVEEILAGIAVVVTGVSGIYIAVHRTRRRERRATAREIDDLVQRTDALERLLLAQREYIFKVVMILADHGIEVPQPPDPSFDPDEY